MHEILHKWSKEYQNSSYSNYTGGDHSQNQPLLIKDKTGISYLPHQLPWKQIVMIIHSHQVGENKWFQHNSDTTCKTIIHTSLFIEVQSHMEVTALTTTFLGNIDQNNNKNILTVVFKDTP